MGAIFKSPPFRLECSDSVNFFFKSQLITKYEKSRTLNVSLLFEKISNRALKKVQVLWIPPSPPGKIGLNPEGHRYTPEGP